MIFKAVFKNCLSFYGKEFNQFQVLMSLKWNIICINNYFPVFKGKKNENCTNLGRNNADRMNSVTKLKKNSLLFLMLVFLLPQNAFCRQVNPYQSKIPIKWFVDGAKQLTREDVSYDASYFRIRYPWGDVPSDKGSCTDFVIRAFRRVGVDLQQEVCKHMIFYTEGNIDPSIVHRRVKNLMAYFSKKALNLPVTLNSEDYIPGDIVVWKVDRRRYHIGIIVDIKSMRNPKRYLVAHHSIKKGPSIHDVLFEWKIAGHYRYF